MMKRISYLPILLVALIAVDSCTSVKLHQRFNEPITPNNFYTSSFPSRNVSEKLQHLQSSVKRVTARVVYTMYQFNNNYLTQKMIRQAGGPDSLISITSTFHHNTAGTAICILNNGNHALFITARHILANPDTLISYRHGKNIPENKYVATVGIKENQQNYLITDAMVVPVHILAEDRNSDLALLVASDVSPDLIPSISISIGNSKLLQMGSFIYILGYPLGVPVVTHGIVSVPNYDSRGSFLTDAISNHGISGGLIIATNNDFRSFEWVGMVLSAFTTKQLYLVPEPAPKGTYWNHEIYTDTLHIAKGRRINYGLLDAVSINEIIQFLFANADKINNYGLYLRDL